MTSLAGPLLVLSIGGGAIQAGAVGTTWFLARLAFELPGGYLADRYDPRRMMITMDALRLLAVGSIPVAGAIGNVSFIQVVSVVLVESAASVVFGSAAMVFLRNIVPSISFSRALTQSEFSAGTISMVGPLLGGALYAVEPLLPFIIDTASYALAILLLLFVSRTRQGPVGDTDIKKAAHVQPVDRRATAGLRWLLQRRGYVEIVVFSSVLNMVGSSLGVAALVVMVERGTSPNAIGIVMALGGAGVIIGSLAAKRLLELKLWLYPVTGLIWSAALATVAVAPTPWVIGSVLFVLAVFGPAGGILLFQMLRDESPNSLFGRVVAAQELLGSLLSMLGPLLAGGLVAILGGTIVWIALASISLTASILMIRPLLVLRPAASQSIPVPQAAEHTKSYPGKQ